MSSNVHALLPANPALSNRIYSGNVNLDHPGNRLGGNFDGRCFVVSGCRIC
jgi:hypothetical protein